MPLQWNSIVWCGRRDSNPHSEELVPETRASTISATSANLTCATPKVKRRFRLKTEVWFHLRGSNARPRPNQERALPTELRRPVITGLEPGFSWCSQKGLSLRASLYKRAALHLSYASVGAGRENRTPDINLTKIAFYQLNYASMKIHKRRRHRRQIENLRCLKPPFAAPPKETSTGSAGHLMSLQGRPS